MIGKDRLEVRRNTSILAFAFAIILFLPGSVISLVPSSNEGPFSTSSPIPESSGSSDHHPRIQPLINISGISPLSQMRACGHDPIIEYQGTLFFIYSWFNSSVITVSVITSKDEGGNWSKKVDIWSSTFHTDSLWHELLIWKGEIYAFINGHHTQHHYRADYMKKADVDHWQDLSTASTISIRSSQGENWKLTYDDDYIYMAMVQSSQWRSIFYRYNGISWTSGTYLSSLGQTYFNSIAAIKTTSGTKLIFSYCRSYFPSYSTGYIYVRTSSNAGSTWSNAQVVMNDHTSYYEHDLIESNGTICLVSALINGGDVQITVSKDNGTTWSEEKTLLEERGPSNYTSSKYSISLGSRDGGRTICLVYECKDDEIRMLFSRDNGATWIDEKDEFLLRNGIAYDPMITRNTKYMSVIIPYGSTSNIEIYDMRDLVLDDYSPTNLSLSRSVLHMNISWDPPQDRFFSEFNFENYVVYRGTSYESLSLYRLIGNVTWFNDSISKMEDVSYFYGVGITFSELGESTLSNIVLGEVLLPPPIDGLRAEAGDFFVNLSWYPPPVAISDAFQISHYTIFRGGYHDSMHPMFTIPFGNNWFNDTTVDRYPGSYLYKLTYTLTGYGEISPSETVSGTPNTLPGTPTGFEMSEKDSGVELIWEPPMSNGGYDIDQYSVYRGWSMDDMVLLGQVDTATMTLTDHDLVQGETYFYSISAINKLGEGLWTAPVKVEYRTVPSAPMELVSISGNGEIVLKWSPPALDWDLPITGYTLYRSVGDGDMSLHFEFGGDVHSFTDPVQNGVKYTYRLSASNMFGEGLLSFPVSGMASGLPGPVTGLSVSLGDSMVDIAWDDVEDDGGSPVLGYHVYRSFQSDQPLFLLDLGSGLLEYSENDLENGLTYYYRISAFNINGDGPISFPISTTPGTDPFMISDISGQAMLFSSRIWWSPPENGGEDVQFNRIYRGTSIHSLTNVARVDVDPSHSPEFHDNDLEYGPVYYYAVTAVNVWGESFLSPIIPVKPYGVPTGPEVYHEDRKLDSFRLFWYPPSDDGGSPIVGYHVSYKENVDTEWSQVETMALSILIKYLTPGMIYQFKVSAFTEFGDGEDTEIMTIKVGSVPDYIEDLSAEVSDGAVDLDWTVPGNGGFDLLGYRIYVEDGRGIPVLYSEIGSVPSFKAMDLENGKEYVFRISAFNEIGEGPLSDRIKAIPVGVPGPVSDLLITKAYMGTVVLHWTDPEDLGGSPLMGSVIYRGLTEGEMDRVGEVLDGVGFFEDADLIDGTSYYYRISCVNAVGEGPKGPSLEVIPLGIPSMVLDLKIEATTDTVDIKWLPPESDHGSEVVGYYIFRGRSPVDLEIWKQLDADRLSVTDEDVEEGTYYYRVVPYNAVGSGDPSDVDVEVPGRTNTAVILGIVSFLVPLLIILLVLFLPGLIRRNKSRREEREAKEALERKESPPLQPLMPPGPTQIGRPGLGPGQGSGAGYGQLPPMYPVTTQAPTRQLPPMQSVPMHPPPSQAPPPSEAYIRPEPKALAFRDRDSYLRQNGMKPSDLVRSNDHMQIFTNNGMRSISEPVGHPQMETDPPGQDPLIDETGNPHPDGIGHPASSMEHPRSMEERDLIKEEENKSNKLGVLE